MDTNSTVVELNNTNSTMMELNNIKGMFWIYTIGMLGYIILFDMGILV